MNSLFEIAQTRSGQKLLDQQIVDAVVFRHLATHHEHDVLLAALGRDLHVLQKPIGQQSHRGFGGTLSSALEGKCEVVALNGQPVKSRRLEVTGRKKSSLLLDFMADFPMTALAYFPGM